MTSKRPTPLKDEPVAPLDELQDLLVKNIAVTNALNKTLSGCPNTQPVSPETVATAAFLISLLLISFRISSALSNLPPLSTH